MTTPRRTQRRTPTTSPGRTPTAPTASPSRTPAVSPSQTPTPQRRPTVTQQQEREALQAWRNQFRDVVDGGAPRASSRTRGQHVPPGGFGPWGCLCGAAGRSHEEAETHLRAYPGLLLPLHIISTRLEHRARAEASRLVGRSLRAWLSAGAQEEPMQRALWTSAADGFRRLMRVACGWDRPSGDADAGDWERVHRGDGQVPEPRTPCCVWYSAPQVAGAEAWAAAVEVLTGDGDVAHRVVAALEALNDAPIRPRLLVNSYQAVSTPTSAPSAGRTGRLSSIIVVAVALALAEGDESYGVVLPPALEAWARRLPGSGTQSAQEAARAAVGQLMACLRADLRRRGLTWPARGGDPRGACAYIAPETQERLVFPRATAFADGTRDEGMAEVLQMLAGAGETGDSCDARVWLCLQQLQHIALQNAVWPEPCWDSGLPTLTDQDFPALAQAAAGVRAEADGGVGGGSGGGGEDGRGGRSAGGGSGGGDSGSGDTTGNGGTAAGGGADAAGAEGAGGGTAGGGAAGGGGATDGGATDGGGTAGGRAADAAGTGADGTEGGRGGGDDRGGDDRGCGTAGGVGGGPGGSPGSPPGGPCMSPPPTPRRSIRILQAQAIREAQATAGASTF